MISSESRNATHVMAISGLILTSLFWAGNALVARYISDTISPFSLSFWRWVIPMILLLPITIRAVSTYKTEIYQKWKQLFVLSLISIATYNTILYTAAQTTTAINITLVSTSLPFGTLLFSIIILKAVPRRLQVIGAVISLGGALTIISQGQWQSLMRVEFNPGDSLMILAVLCWSLYSVLIKHWHINIPSLPLLCLLITIGTPIIAPFYLADLIQSGGFEVNRENLLVLAYVGIFPSVIAYLCWNFGVKTLGPATASVFSYLIPVFTTVLSIQWLGEAPQLYHFAGGLLTLTGLILATRTSNKATNEHETENK